MKLSYKIKVLRFLKKIFSSEGIIKDIIEGLGVLLIFAFVIKIILKKEFDIYQFLEFDIAVTVSLTMIIAGALRIFIKIIDKHLEESTKLDIDTDKLFEFYGENSEYLVYKNRGDRENKNIGIKYTSCSLYNAENEIESSQEPLDSVYRFPIVVVFRNPGNMKFTVIDSNSMYQLPQIVISNYTKLFTYHSSSKVFNNLIIRIKDWYIKQEENQDIVVLETERTTFFNSLVTNRALDAPLCDGLSLRTIFQYDKKLVPMSESMLSNHLGINGFVETADEKIILVKRREDVSISKKMWGTSIGYAVKASGMGNQKFSEEILEREIKDALKKELGICQEYYEFSNERNIIAGYRDLLEGGKPQLLFYVKVNLTETEIYNNFLQYDFENAMEKDGDKLQFIPRNELNHIFITPEGIAYNKKFYMMRPTVSSSLVLLNEYFNSIL